MLSPRYLVLSAAVAAGLYAVRGAEHPAPAPAPKKVALAAVVPVVAPPVLADGTCSARVVGFAEVSRVSGEPPGTEEYYYHDGEGDADGDDERKNRDEPPKWTIDDVRQHGVTLAARLDGCGGTWARASEF